MTEDRSSHPQGGDERHAGRDQDDPSGSGPRASRREFLKGAAAFGVAAVALPAVRDSGVMSLRPRDEARAASSGSSSTLWNGQQVTEPIGLSAVGKPARGGDLTWAWIFEPIAQMDPQLPTTGDNGDLGTLLWIYDQLTNIIPGTLINGPGLAEHWDVDKGGLEYVFYLRDADFSTGDKVTANDVKFSLERFANPKINGQYAFLSAIDTVEALNPTTVRVNLQYVQAMFPQTVGHAVYRDRPAGHLREAGQGLRRTPDRLRAVHVRVQGPGRDDHPEAEPELLEEPDAVDRLGDDELRPRRQRPHAAGGPRQRRHRAQRALRTARDLPRTSGTRLQLEPYTNVIFAVPNMLRAPLQEANVRLALNYATPRDVINRRCSRTPRVLANSPIGQLRYWDPTVPNFPYDLSKAKSLMAKSSVPNGYSASLLIVGTDSDSVSVAEILQAAWLEIGVKLGIQDVDLDTMFSRFYSRRTRTSTSISSRRRTARPTSATTTRWRSSSTSRCRCSSAATSTTTSTPPSSSTRRRTPSTRRSGHATSTSCSATASTPTRRSSPSASGRTDVGERPCAGAADAAQPVLATRRGLDELLARPGVPGPRPQLRHDPGSAGSG